MYPYFTPFCSSVIVHCTVPRMCPSADGHVGCFHFSAAMSNAAINAAHTVLRGGVLSFPWNTPRSGVLAPLASLCLTL